MGRPSLLSVLLCVLAGCVAATAPLPPNIVAEGVPPVPPTLVAELSPYLNLGGAGFRGWHSGRREAIVTTRIGDASHLHLMAAPLAKRVPLTGGVEPVKSGQMQPGGTLLLVAPNAAGYAVTAGTGDLLKVANSGGSTGVTYDIVIVGL